MTENDGRRGVDATGLAIDATSSAVGALVGFAVGGPVGAVLGGAASPVMARVGRIATGAITRRTARLERVATVALSAVDGEIESGLRRLEDAPDVADTFFQLLSQVVDSDEALDTAFTALLAEVVRGDRTEIERAVMIADSLRGLRATHMRVLQAIASTGGELSAIDIAGAVGIPEVELRGAVRSLEARGMIKDLGVHPVQWRIRELGTGVVRLGAGTEK